MPAFFIFSISEQPKPVTTAPLVVLRSRNIFDIMSYSKGTARSDAVNLPEHLIPQGMLAHVGKGKRSIPEYSTADSFQSRAPHPGQSDNYTKPQNLSNSMYYQERNANSTPLLQYENVHHHQPVLNYNYVPNQDSRPKDHRLGSTSYPVATQFPSNISGGIDAAPNERYIAGYSQRPNLQYVDSHARSNRSFTGQITQNFSNSMTDNVTRLSGKSAHDAIFDKGSAQRVGLETRSEVLIPENYKSNSSFNVVPEHGYLGATTSQENRMGGFLSN